MFYSYLRNRDQVKSLLKRTVNFVISVNFFKIEKIKKKICNHN